MILITDRAILNKIRIGHIIIIWKYNNYKDLYDVWFNKRWQKHMIYEMINQIQRRSISEVINNHNDI